MKTKTTAIQNLPRWGAGLLGLASLAAADLSALTANAAQEPVNSSITVRASEPGRPASTDLYGIFVEDWSHQIEGGIYAEMIRNRNFDDTKSAKEVLVAGFDMRLPETGTTPDGKTKDVPGWKKTSDDAIMEWSLDNSTPLNARNPRSLKLMVNDTAKRPAIWNEGHCTNVVGIAVTKGSDYLFSIFARAEQPGTAITVNIETPEGDILASATIDGLTKEWKKYERTLTPSASLTGARLVVAPAAKGAYYLDMISLFPRDTWKGRPNGLRKDLMEFVAAMKPAFVRFPGGCFVEGLERENAWAWKNTLGPVEERPGHWNIWGWRYSGGMGYHEFLLMCEDLGAEPVHVVDDGISHTTKDGVQLDGVYVYHPMDRMHELVQDALDSIEYAIGPTNSTWGAKRAAAGHPEPFSMKYIEIGNENYGPEYAERYALFHDAIKEKYPDIKIIMDSWGPNNYPRNRRADLLDIHRFTTPYQHAINYHQFDTYDRTAMPVYFGEWCIELELPNKESLENGLYEGAFLTGLEKNSDIVPMMSYAPFMKNLGWQDRKPNMIGFDLDRVYGAPIYWIQKMYAENVISTILPFEMNSPDYRPAKLGSMGFGTQDTAAQFKDIKVLDAEGKVMFDADTAPRSEWQRPQKKKATGEKPAEGLVEFDAAGTHMSLTERVFKGDYTIIAKARKLEGKNGFNIYFNTYFNSRSYWQLGGDGNKSSKLIGEGFAGQKIQPFAIENDRWYDLRMEIRGDNIRCYVDGTLINEISYQPLHSLYVSAGRDDHAGEIVLKVINLTPVDQSTRIHIPGVTVSPKAKLVVMTHDDPLAKNSMAEPNRVVPVATVIENASNDFEHLFPAFSVNVVRLKEIPGKAE